MINFFKKIAQLKITKIIFWSIFFVGNLFMVIQLIFITIGYMFYPLTVNQYTGLVTSITPEFLKNGIIANFNSMLFLFLLSGLLFLNLLSLCVIFVHKYKKEKTLKFILRHSVFYAVIFLVSVIYLKAIILRGIIIKYTLFM